ncbi:ATP-dependent DNA helicase RecG [Thiolapillus brandeum]|uniref:ATP-dependent DNA helicase RecG n=1 Tax=Thiolapillus brandeum TaxID=1076588 RepID=A0A7U6GGB6_9GAMM|nr:ATP-dependent DNA helicase RecG [Thiolapillus brandeum]BAO43142.1 ATP-dependent DNA recombinase RecG [Thiolapillus brandeum]
MTAHADELSRLPVTVLKGVGPKSAERLARLDIETVQDVLFHLPLRYQDRTRVVPMGQLRSGEEAVIEGEIEHVEIRFGRRRSLLVHLSDGSGRVILRFFHFSAAQKNALKPGLRLHGFGEVRNGPACQELVHPEYRLVSENDTGLDEASLTPVYPTTEGMHQLSWRDLTDKALLMLHNSSTGLQEWLPADLLREYQLMELGEAIAYLHRPPPDAPQRLLLEGRHPAQQRLAFEELVAHQLSLRQARQLHRNHRGPILDGDERLQKALIGQLPFSLTAAQQRVLQEISRDMAQGRPMLRLVQGDVGSGKTVVAALAAMQALGSGHQVALMAPTELLAEQHLKSFRQWLEPLQVRVGWLSGSVKGKVRQSLLEDLAQGRVGVLVGTQALFQEDVKYHSLGLVIVDEQHRFGVHQRLALREKGVQDGCYPHQLIMTATPIPRSLAMTAYADLDLSVIDELPPGRTPVTTVVVSDQRRDQIIERVRAACARGRQAYWVCTLIEESEVLQCQAAEDVAAELQAELESLRVGLVHGRLSSQEKEQVMQAFKNGDIHLLVATTVIEVGVDVPNASLMIIENPERLGLSQLHQLRGRVGRGEVESHCVLLYHPPLGETARERLAVLRDSSDGFIIARKDLELRGPGEVLGVRQTGEMQFRIADILRDQAMLEPAREAADRLLDRHPEVVKPLVKRWLGSNTQYARV